MFYVCCGVGDTCDGPCIIAGSVVTLYTGLWVVIVVVAYTITCFDLCSAAFIGFCVICFMPTTILSVAIKLWYCISMLVIMLWCFDKDIHYVCYFYVIFDNFGFPFCLVGRGVLRFPTARYRKPRSNLGPFSGFWGSGGKLGVDII